MKQQKSARVAALSLLLAMTLIPAGMGMPAAGRLGGIARAEQSTGEGTEETPSPSPTPEETPSPSPTPEETPSPSPTPEETPSPSPTPTDQPTEKPTDQPTEEPTDKPTDQPTEEPTDKPTDQPTDEPTDEPTEEPEWEIQGDMLVACHSQAAVVTVPKGIREIGPNAFREMKTLEAVVLPDTVEKIGSGAFAECERLREVVLSSESLLAEIGAQAFLNCVKLDPGFVPEGVKVADSAFDGAGTERATATPTPAATPTAAPTETPAATPTAEPAPTPAPTPEETPEATENPEEEDDIDDGEDEEEMPEDDGAVFPAWSGGGGYSSGLPQGHAKNTLTSVAEYDLVSLKDIPPEGTGAMTRLTLGGETLEVRLTGEDAAEASFTVSVMRWDAEAKKDIEPENPDGSAEPEEDGKTRAEEEPDTLVLTAAEEAEGTWTLNGEVLRKLRKSGIRHLVFRSGERMAAAETEGFLAGWEYDLLKSRGTASRRFEYALEMDGEKPVRWRVTVEGNTYELTADDHAGIYLTGAWEGSAEVLNLTWEQAVEKRKNTEKPAGMAGETSEEEALKTAETDHNETEKQKTESGRRQKP